MIKSQTEQINDKLQPTAFHSESVIFREEDNLKGDLRMKTKKVWLGLILILCMGLVLSACGGTGKNNNAASSGTNGSGSGNKSGNAANAPADSPSEPAPDNAAKTGSDKAFTIRVGAWFIDDRPYQQAFKKSIEDKYKELYPNAKIQWDITLGATYFDKLKAQLASESAPDVIFYQGAQYITDGYLADLSAEPWVARLNDAGQKDLQTHSKGKTYGLPMGGGIGGGVWYNTKIFEDLGLQPPTTTQEFMDVSEKIKQAKITPVALGFKDGWTAQMFLFSWLESYLFSGDPDIGKKIYDGERKLDDPAIQTVFQNLQLMKEKGYFNKNALSIDWPQSAQLFAQGEAAMIVQGPWMPGANKDNIEKGGFKDFQIGFFPLMDDKGNAILQVGGNEGLGINAKTGLMQESKDMVNLISSPEIYGPFMVGEGSLSSLSDISVTYEDKVMDVVQAAVAKSSLPVGLGSYVSTSAANAMIDVTTKVVSGVKFDPADLKSAMDNLVKDKATIVLPE